MDKDQYNAAGDTQHFGKRNRNCNLNQMPALAFLTEPHAALASLNLQPSGHASVAQFGFRWWRSLQRCQKPSTATQYSLAIWMRRCHVMLHEWP